METSGSSNAKLSETNESIKMSNLMYKRRPPTPTRFAKRFELGDIDAENSTNSKSSKLNPEVEREEIALKDELLRIFNREKDAMEQHYLNKIQELLRSFKGKKLEWEEMVKAEREDLESQFEVERSDMHQSFAQEIAKLTRSFQEEKADMERRIEEKSRHRETEFGRERKDITDTWKNQIDNVKRQCQAEHDAMMTIEMKNENEKHKCDLEHLEKRFDTMKYDLEKKFERDLADVETKYEKMNFEAEKKFEEEKNKLDRDWQRRLEGAQDALRKEVNHRAEVERTAANDKANMQAVNNMLKDEIGRLKEEIDRLRKLPPPPPEVKIIEKKIPADPPPIISYNSRSDLPACLREDFDRILNEYKDALKDKFQKDQSAMEERLEMERERLKERIVKEKEELDKRLSEEKFRMERDLDRSRDDIEKEIERRLRTKQLSESLAVQQQRFDEVTRRLEEEEKSRRERMRDTDNKKYENIIQELMRENEGLKAKVHVLEDNNKVLKNLKEEGQEEVERLRKAVEELKIIVEARRENERTRAQTPAEFTPFLMSMAMQQQPRPTEEREPTSFKSNIDDLSAERKKLEDLKNELQKQERDMRDRKTIEDAAKMVADRSQEKYDSLLSEKRKLEDALRALESRVVGMQEEFMKMRYANPQPYPHPPPPQPPTQQVVTQPQPIIVQPPVVQQSPPITEKSEPTVNFISIPSPGPHIPAAPAPTPFHFPYYLPPQAQPQPMFSPVDQSDKIFKLKTAKERLTRQLDELQSELKEANHENNILQKQCREFERQFEKLGDGLEREREVSVSLRDLLNEERDKVNKFKDELERESQNVIRTRNEMEDMRLKLQREIQELQAKLHHAGQTLAAVRQQASSDITASPLLTGFTPQPPNDPTVGMVSMSPTMKEMVPFFTANAKRRLNLFKKSDPLNALGRRSSLFDISKDDPNIKDEMTRIRALEETRAREEMTRRALEETKAREEIARRALEETNAREELARMKALEETKVRDEITRRALEETKAREEMTRMRALEEEKMRLQNQLDDARGALDAYSGKLDSQLFNLQSKVGVSNSRAKELSHGMEQNNQARQNLHLRQQKMQLQRLIERLTSMNPQS